MDAKGVGFDGFALAYPEPNHRHRLEDSLRQYGLLLMLFGAAMVFVTIGSSSANSQHVLLGFSLLLFGFVLLGFSELHGSAAAERFMVLVVGALDDFFGRR